MNDAPRRKLSEIINKHGHSVIENPSRLEGLLRDYCGAHRREISVLMSALEEHAVADLLAGSRSLPRKALLARLAQRLCDNRGLSEAAAVWAVESWALTLGLISDAQITPGEAAPQTEKTASETGKSDSASSVAKTANAAAGVSPKPSANSFVVAANGGDFSGIGEALRAVAPNSRLLVREGFYNESVVLDKNVEIVGDGAVENIVVRSANASAVSMRTEKATVRGLTLQGRGAQSGKSFFAVEIPMGELILENCRITSDTLSGVAVFGAGASPLIKNCLVHDCADSGFYIFDNASPRIENCNVYRNANVGAAITEAAVPILKNCRIFEGASGGVVVWGNGAAGVIEDCRIYGHRLANVGVSEYANPTFRRCEIFGGRDTGVFVHRNGYGTFEECDIYRNAKAEVGVSGNANSVFRRCAIREGENSGVVLRNQARALVESCNIYDNQDAGIAIYGASEAIVRRCNIHRNRKVAIRVKEQSAARVEDCDLRGNFLAAWETEHGVVVEDDNNREH